MECLPCIFPIRCYSLSLIHILCEARTLRGPVAALPVNDFVVLAAASYADRLQLARLLHAQGEFIQRRLIQIAARV